MIEYIKGTITELTPATATVETAGGVGYLLNITLATYAALEAPAADKSVVSILVQESVREDAWTLYGFASRRERDMFRLLVSVSGIGAGTARVILSTMTVDELSQAIAAADHSRLKAVKGIGLKTAQRVVVDLHDKMTAILADAGDVATAPGAPAAPAATDAVRADAVESLVVLGYARAAADKVVQRLLKADPGLKVDQTVRQALAFL